MPKVTYPFVLFEYEDGTKDSLAHPYLPLVVSNPYEEDETMMIWGLVDTGADSSLFPASLATDLKHDLKGDGVKSSLNVGIEQNSITVYSHTFKLQLLAPDRKKVVWTSDEAEIECSETEPPVLIGVKNFLKDFKLIVDYPNQEFQLVW